MIDAESFLASRQPSNLLFDSKLTATKEFDFEAHPLQISHEGLLTTIPAQFQASGNNAEGGKVRDFSPEPTPQPTLMPGLMFNRVNDYDQFPDADTPPKGDLYAGELQFNQMNDSYDSPHFSIRSSDADMVYDEKPGHNFDTFQMSNDVSQSDSYEAEPGPIEYIRQQQTITEKKKPAARAKLNKVSSHKTLRNRPSRKCADKSSDNGASDQLNTSSPRNLNNSTKSDDVAMRSARSSRRSSFSSAPGRRFSSRNSSHDNSMRSDRSLPKIRGPNAIQKKSRFCEKQAEANMLDSSSSSSDG